MIPHNSQEGLQTSDGLQIEHGVSPRSKDSSSIHEKNITVINSSSNTLNVYFNCCYYMLLLPFRPEYDKTTGQCNLDGSRLQKILVYYVMWPLMILNDITKSVRRFVKASTTASMTIRQYCKIFASLLYTFKQLKFLYVAYKCQRLIQKYLTVVKTNSLLQKQHEEPSKSKLLSKVGHYFGWRLPFLIFIFFVYIFNYFQIGRIVIFHFNDEFLPKSRLYVVMGGQNGTELDSIGKIVSGGVEIIFILVSLFDHFLVHLFFLLPIPLWVAVRRLERLVLFPIADQVNFREILGKYQEIKLISRFCNEIWGSLTLLWILDYSTTLVLNFDERVRSKSLVDVVLLFGSQALLITALIMAAEVTRIVERLKEYLTIHYKHGEKAKSGSQQVVHELIDELETFPVGIGNTGVYRLDYGFLSQLLCSVIVTLFVGVPPPST
ncbi:hypothetical protein Ocin01_14381 [Orchesella cincta]|uniref:Gustatory receptor n=1 Tax=Orchesella cincta TaxID=48709 RepID=A0A1D2MH27_ORCCI|nr:hypothetical protein Ocin01_14381 [Orchesella cincta]